MQRCIELAILGAGSVAPNPMVGAVLVHQNRIIGEGYHQQYGHAHAEVNCVNAVSVKDKVLIKESTLYVSLEPCAHTGKTPPCTDLIIAQQIPRVVIGSTDIFQQVNGKGIEKLKKAGVEVITDVFTNDCKDLNKRFFTFHTHQRPFIILKWAQTADGKIASGATSRLLISNEYSNRVVHKWRSEEAAVLVGTNTALLDDPALTNRLWTGGQPVRLVLDRQLKLPGSLQLFNRLAKTIVFNTNEHKGEGNLVYYRLQAQGSIIKEMMDALYQLNIQSVLVEGGATLLQSFIDEKLWDEARIITNNSMQAGNGIPAPKLTGRQLISTESIQSDVIEIYKPGYSN
jgi:diaminohydroxyphosphoribosylaminopyrimidine deaminase / 5-amino-6-(5-phosphoribosylamino)uracil reductase